MPDDGTTTTDATPAADATTATTADATTTTAPDASTTTATAEPAADATAKPDEGPDLAAELAEAKAALKAIEDAKLSDEEKAARELAELREQVAEGKAKELRAEVAAAKGVPAALADLLGTGDKKSMETIAAKIKTAIDAAVTEAKKGTPGGNGLGGVTKVTGTSMVPGDGKPGFDPKAAARARFEKRRGR